MTMTMRPRITQVITTQTKTRAASVFSHNRIGSTINTPTSTTKDAATIREHTTLIGVLPSVTVATIAMQHRPPRPPPPQNRSLSSSSSTTSKSPSLLKRQKVEEDKIKNENENENENKEEIIARNKTKQHSSTNTNAVTNSKKTNKTENEEEIIARNNTKQHSSINTNDVTNSKKTKEEPEDQVTTSNTSSSSSSRTGGDENDEAQLNWKERKQAPTWMQKIAPTKGGKWPPQPHEVVIMMSGLIVFVWSWTS